MRRFATPALAAILAAGCGTNPYALPPEPPPGETEDPQNETDAVDTDAVDTDTVDTDTVDTDTVDTDTVDTDTVDTGTVDTGTVDTDTVVDTGVVDTGVVDTGLDTTDTATPGAAIKTIFVIVMENHNWSDIVGNNDAPYINDVLLRSASYADNYYATPDGIHPSEPNYIWMEAGDNLGIYDDDDPEQHMLDTTDHLVSQLERAGVSWHSYQEDMPAGICPVYTTGMYQAKHNPFVFFTDVAGDPPSPDNAYCASHHSPYAALEEDLVNNTVARYNFLTPNQCHDMHDQCGSESQIASGDRWLASEVPKILASQAYLDGGVLFITFDESVDGEHPIAMIALSPLAKGNGYVSHTRYYHSSLLRTVEEVFGVPLLRDANNHPSLSDLFTQYP